MPVATMFAPRQRRLSGLWEEDVVSSVINVSSIKITALAGQVCIK